MFGLQLFNSHKKVVAEKDLALRQIQQLEKKVTHQDQALSAILTRCDGIACPNGTTKVIARIATAGICGLDSK